MDGRWRGGLRIGDMGGGEASKAILIVEPDSDFRDVLLREISRAGYTVVPAPHSMAALNLLDVRQFDGLVSAVEFGPGQLHGVALARMMKRRRPLIAVVILCDDPDVLAEEVDLPGPVVAKPAGALAIVAHLKQKLAP